MAIRHVRRSHQSSMMSGARNWTLLVYLLSTWRSCCTSRTFLAASMAGVDSPGGGASSSSSSLSASSSSWTSSRILPPSNDFSWRLTLLIRDVVVGDDLDESRKSRERMDCRGYLYLKSGKIEKKTLIIRFIKKVWKRDRCMQTRGSLKFFLKS